MFHQQEAHPQHFPINYIPLSTVSISWSLNWVGLVHLQLAISSWKQAIWTPKTWILGGELSLSFRECIPPKINMSPEKGPFQKEDNLPTSIFQGMEEILHQLMGRLPYYLQGLGYIPAGCWEFVLPTLC